MALSREGVGVVDVFGLLEEHRGRGLGIGLLAAGISRLAGKTNTVWLDIDEDNGPAVSTCKRAGFRIHHRHGGMTAALTAP
jgi:ribosomal protein S18 acetylase RimI-like enzyme